MTHRHGYVGHVVFEFVFWVRAKPSEFVLMQSELRRTGGATHRTVSQSGLHEHEYRCREVKHADHAVWEL
jgi:hypothetical protein